MESVALLVHRHNNMSVMKRLFVNSLHCW